MKIQRAGWKRLLCLAVLLVMCGVFAPRPVAAEAEAGRVVRVACGMNEALYLDETGTPQGCCLYYLRQLAWNENWTVEYVEGSYSEGIQNLMDGTVDLMFPVGKSDDPDGKLAFADFIGGYQQIGLFARADADLYYDDYAAFDGKRVALSIGSNSEVLDRFAAAHGFGYEAVPLNTIQDKIDALQDGTVDLIAFSTLNKVPGGKLVAVLEQVPFYFCTAAENTELLAELNDAMGTIMVNTPDVATDMFGSVLEGSNAVSMTREEAEKIAAADTVTFGVYGDRLPLAGVNADGECVGIYVDVLKEMAAASGLNLEIKPVEDSNRLYSYMDDGTVDFVIGVQELRFYSANAENYLASNGIGEYTTVAVTMPSYRFTPDDAPTVALTRDRNYLEDYINANCPGAVIRYCDTTKDCLDAVLDGGADATFLNTWEYNYETKNLRYRDLIEWESMRITSVFGLGATRQSDLELLSILEKAVSQLPPETVSEIVAKNLNRSYDTYNWKDRLYEYKNVLVAFAAFVMVTAAVLGVYMRVKRRYIRKLIAANQAKTDFLSRMSHELRTPLNAISGYAQDQEANCLAPEFDKQREQKATASILRAVRYQQLIIGDLLNMREIESGKIQLNLEEIDFAAFMNSVVEMMRPEAEAKQIAFTYDRLTKTSETYRLDPVRLQQILINLLHNAVKFTPAGGSVRLTAQATAQEGSTVQLRFVVADTGIGMSKEFLKNRLFQNFAQEYSGTTSPYEGCGIGLATCKELVELMHGTITCESVQGQGTTFTVELAAEAVTPKKGRRAAVPVPCDLQGVRLLLCEDNEMNQEIEKRLLERMGCTVEIAENGKVGCEKFAASEQGGYAMILMDIRMPEMDGLEAARTIRAMARADAATVPIVAVSANAFEEDVQKSLDAGMNEHLPKPMDVHLIHDKIRRYCVRRMDGET